MLHRDLDSKINRLEKKAQNSLEGAIKKLEKAKHVNEKRVHLMGTRGQKTEVHGAQPELGPVVSTAYGAAPTVNPASMVTTTTTTYAIPQAHYNQALALIVEAEQKIRQAEALLHMRDTPISTVQQFTAQPGAVSMQPKP